MSSSTSQQVVIDGKTYKRTLYFPQGSTKALAMYAVLRDGEHWSHLHPLAARHIIARIDARLPRFQER